VDDDAGDRKQIMRALQHSRLSYQAVEASAMSDALAVCKTQVFDCAIVDYHMPGQDGLSAFLLFRSSFHIHPHQLSLIDLHENLKESINLSASRTCHLITFWTNPKFGEVKLPRYSDAMSELAVGKLEFVDSLQPTKMPWSPVCWQT
jgi:hypothetical protein